MQTILLAPVLALGIFILPLILMLPLGAWQMASALVKGLAWRSRLHLTYFGVAALYCLALWAGFSGTVEASFPRPLEEIWGHEAWSIFFVIIIPLVGAIKYWKISRDDCKWDNEQLV